MSFKKISALSAMAAALVGCGGGDVNISPSTSTNIGDTTTVIEGGGSAGFSCAEYTVGGTTSQGSYDGTHCTYTRGFVDIDNPLMVDVTFPNIGNGVHIFEGSLVVGQSFNTNAGLASENLDQGGDGPVLTLAAGTTLAFRSSDDMMLINRGSQIRANGTAEAPITITSQTDAVFGTVEAEEVGAWGGLIINGFGITNKCAYTGTYGVDLELAGECHVQAEGKAGAGENFYGGNNDDDNSGVLRYFIVKHPGAEVAPGNELNGITFNGVGRGTTIDHLQVYSTYDDGIEFFGGAVDVNNFVALYARDDSIDIDESYRGTITNALVIQQRQDGAHCVESDGLGSYPGDLGRIAQGLHSQATLVNMTCIISANDAPPGTHEAGRGLRIREGHMPTIQNSIVTTAYSGDDTLGDATLNYCLRIDNESQQMAIDGDLVIEASVFACQDTSNGATLPGGVTKEAWLRSNGNAVYQSAEAGEDPTAASNPDLVILDGFYSIPVASMAAGADAIPAPVNGATFLGAVTADDDWTAGWTYGLHPENRAQPLWFE